MTRPKRETGSQSIGQSGEPGVFVIWQSGRRQEDRILEDIGQKFRILDVTEIHWSPAFVWSNFQRFYADIDVRGVYHEINKGRGPFLAIRLMDERPAYDLRLTGRGERPVNTGLFDVKELYRQWTGGLGIHCGETLWETRRDLFMLFGEGPENETINDEFVWDGAIRQRHCDVTGAGAWASCHEVFEALNRSVTYVLTDPTLDLQSLDSAQHDELEILAKEHRQTQTILDSRSWISAPKPKQREIRVRVRTSHLNVRLRSVPDENWQDEWIEAALESRILSPQGYYLADAAHAEACAAHRAASGESIDHSPFVPLQRLGRLIAVRTFAIYYGLRDRIVFRAQWLRTIRRALRGSKAG